MDQNRWLRLAERMMDASGPRQRARALVDEVPASTLAGLGLARTGSSMAVAVGAFAVGAVLGAGAVIFFAPGSESVRSELAVELERTKRLARRTAARARARPQSAAKPTAERVGERFEDQEDERPEAHA